VATAALAYLPGSGQQGQHVCKLWPEGLGCMQHSTTPCSPQAMAPPMLDTVMVPPARSSADSLPAAAPARSLSSSAAMPATLLPATSFTLGTTRPPEVAMATPMLC
jgi:hypothetical protein